MKFMRDNLDNVFQSMEIKDRMDDVTQQSTTWANKDLAQNLLVLDKFC